MNSSAEPSSQRVETELLLPTSFSQQSALFTLPQKGILDGDLQLQLSLKSADGNQRMPLTVGILGCIDTITMYYNNELIQQTRNVAYKARMNNTFVEPEVRNQTHNVQFGAFDGLDVKTGNNAGVVVATGQNLLGQYFLNREIVGLDNDTLGGTDPLIGADRLNNFDRAPGFRITDSASTTPEYRVKLKDLLPILGQVSIPLGLLTGRFTIQIDWSRDIIGNRVVPTSTWSEAAPSVETDNDFVVGNDILQNSCQLIVDYIYFDEVPDKKSPMDLIAEQMASSGLDLIYTDYVNIDISIQNRAAPIAAATRVQEQHYLGLDHQVVRNITCALPRQVTNNELKQGGRMNTVYGKFESVASMGDSSLQLTCNNQPIFPLPLNMDAKMYQSLCEVYGSPCKLNQGQTSWYNQTGGTTDVAFPRDYFGTSSVEDVTFNNGSEKYRLNSFVFGKSWTYTYDTSDRIKMNGVCGTEQYLGINLSHTRENIANAGLTIGRSPITIRLERTLTPKLWEAQQLLCWAECERQMTLRSGTIFVSGS
jgi:hypothetical protein